MNRRRENIVFAIIITILVACLYALAFYLGGKEKAPEWKVDVKAMKAEAKYRATKGLDE